MRGPQCIAYDSVNPKRGDQVDAMSKLPHGPVTPKEQPSTQALNQGGSTDAARMAF